MIQRSLLLLAAATMLVVTIAAQTQQTGSIRGTVRTAGMTPAATGVNVSASRGPILKTVETDAEGRFSFGSLEPGEYHVCTPARPDAFGVSNIRRITVGAGQELSNIDFSFSAGGEFSGRVVTAKHQPIPGVPVFLVIREYTLGALRHSYGSFTDTDTEGRYKFSVPAGRSYLVVAQRWALKLNPVSEAPADPKRRQPVLVPTYFPGTDVIEAAQPIVLQAGEHRDGVDIPVIESPSYCIDGPLESGLPVVRRFELIPAGFTTSMSGNGGLQMLSPSGPMGPDGKIRLCDLHRGDYQLSVLSQANRSPSEEWASTAISITDRDLKRVALGVRAKISAPGEVAWHGTAPDPPLPAKLSIAIFPFSRGPMRTYQAAIPGQFTIENAPMDDYRLQIAPVPEGVYVKDVTYDGRSVLREPLRLGTALGNAGLRIVLAHDGGIIHVKVADKESKPIGDATVLVIPSVTGSDAALAAAMINARTDQNGDWISPHLAPGKYFVLVTMDRVDVSPESISKVARSLTRARDAEVPPNGSVQLTLQPTTID